MPIRRRFPLALALLLVAALVPVLPAVPAAAASGDCAPAGAQIVCTFTYTGAVQTWTVPAGITSATFDVYGARGGASYFAGGKGGRATATLAVTPGQVYTLLVGGHGGDVADGTLPGGAGGFNGGGDGGIGIRVPF